MSKYYTPHISDLFIGYEFEQASEGRPGYPEWLPNCKVEDGDDLEYIRTGEWKIRTPYLTPEQMEKEGWVTTQDGENLYTRKGKYELETITFIRNGEISIYITIHRDGKGVYVGQCPSINEFRKISKLLGI